MYLVCDHSCIENQIALLIPSVFSTQRFTIPEFLTASELIVLDFVSKLQCLHGDPALQDLQQYYDSKSFHMWSDVSGQNTITHQFLKLKGHLKKVILAEIGFLPIIRNIIQLEFSVGVLS